MAVSEPYFASALTRADIDQCSTPTVLDFGTNWCGHCQAARPLVDAALQSAPHVTHQKIEDGKGRALGRSFGVKLWPTLIFLRGGRELARVVRPTDANVIEQALQRLQT